MSCLPTEGSVNVLPNTRQHCMLQLKLFTNITDPNFDTRANRDLEVGGGGGGGGEGGRGERKKGKRLKGGGGVS